MDNRHEKRIQLVQNLYAASFVDLEKIKLPNPSEKKITFEILLQKEKLDGIISRHAPKYPLDKISRIDLAIMRLAVFELLITESEPSKVIINEAVELGKELGNERSFAFVNAVLGSILQELETHKV